MRSVSAIFRNLRTPSGTFIGTLLASFLVPFLAFAAFASTVRAEPSCAVLFESTRLQSNQPLLHLSPAMQADLRRAHHHQIKQALREFQHKSDRIHELMIAGERYTVLALLGKGVEGQVYLVQKNGTLFAAKVFYESEKQIINRQKLDHLISIGVNTIETLVTDAESRTVLFPYVPGIAPAKLHRIPRVSASTVDAVEAQTHAYYEFWRVPAGHGFTIQPLIDVRTMSLIVIDPN